jgi:23S rRNA pseudouridine2605 synthase
MLKAVGYPVKRLIRLQVGPIYLGHLPPGKWRRLSPREVEALLRETPVE